MRPRPARALLATGLGMLALVTAGTAAAATPTPVPRTPTFVRPAEQTVPYEPQTTCVPEAQPGTARFRALVLATYPNTRDMGIVRPCSAGGTSEHKDGRAWDWGVQVTNPAEARQATALIGQWLLGDRAEMARRLGIMYIVFNDRILATYRFSEGWRPYLSSACRTIPLTSCSPTLRHRNHAHFSFSRAGGAARTTFWTGRAAGEAPLAPLSAATLRAPVAAAD